MVGAHHRNGVFDARPAACTHGREQDHLCLGDVIRHLARKRGQGTGKTLGSVRIIGVNMFDALGQGHERGEVRAVHVVRVGPDVVDQCAGFLLHCGGGIVVHGTCFLW